MKTEIAYRVIAVHIDPERFIQSAYDLELQLNDLSEQGWKLEHIVNNLCVLSKTTFTTEADIPDYQPKSDWDRDK